MAKLVIVDLDGVSVDNSARAARATGPDGRMDWAALFDNTQITALDQPLAPALARLQTLAATGHTIWYVTSRPDSCQATTAAWLAAQGYPDAAQVVCRPQFAKTVEYKAAQVARLHAEAGPAVLFVDDREDIRAAVAALNIDGLEIADSL